MEVNDTNFDKTDQKSLDCNLNFSLSLPLLSLSDDVLKLPVRHQSSHDRYVLSKGII